MPYYTLCGASVNSELRLLEFRVTGAPTVPDFQNLDAPVPIVVEDSDRTVFPDEIDIAVFSLNELAVIRQTARVHRGKVHVFFKNKHAFGVNVTGFTCFRFAKG